MSSQLTALCSVSSTEIQTFPQAVIPHRPTPNVPRARGYSSLRPFVQDATREKSGLKSENSVIISLSNVKPPQPKRGDFQIESGGEKSNHEKLRYSVRLVSEETALLNAWKSKTKATGPPFWESLRPISNTGRQSEEQINGERRRKIV